MSPSECSQALATTIATCEGLGVPLAEDKTGGPVTEMSILGAMVKVMAGARVVRNEHTVAGVLSGTSCACSHRVPLGEGIPECTFCDKSSHQTRADGMPQPGRPLRASQVGPTPRTLAWLIAAPILAVKAAGSTHIHGSSGILGHGRHHTGFTYSGAASGACRQLLSKNCYP